MIGVAVSAESAVLGQEGLQPGATVFSGDRLRVAPGGSAVVSVPGQSTLSFGAGASATLSRYSDGGKVTVDLQEGGLQFVASGSEMLEIRLADAVIRAAAPGPVKAIVAHVTTTKALVGTEAGAVVVSTPHDGRSVTVSAGDSVEIDLVSAAPEPQASEPVAKTSSARRTALIGVLVAGGIVSLAWLTSSALTRDQQQDLVSPFRLP